MEFTSNEHMIINLLNFEYYIKASELGKNLFVSDKTVRRSIKKINDSFSKKYDHKLILANSGKGFILNVYFKDKDISLPADDPEVSSVLDINEVLLSLLFGYPKKHHRQILNDDYLSASAKNKKVQRIRKALKSYNIDYHQKREYVWIEGTENNIRKAIRAITQQTNLAKIESDLYPADRQFIDKQIELIEEKSHNVLNYPYDLTITAHLYMLIKRVREGKIQPITNADVQFENKVISKNPELRKLAKLIIDNLSSYLSVNLNESEVHYFFETLYVINFERRESKKIDKVLADLITQKLITSYFGISDITLLYQSRKLYGDLYQHILPMLSRLQLGVTIENNLLEDVKHKYFQTFNKLKKIVTDINTELAFSTKIDESEIGYLTLYFEKYSIEVKKEKRVLLICTTGVGTSELLKARLRNKIPSLDVIATMSVRQVIKNVGFVKQNVDFILSTVNTKINDVENIPVIMISSLLTEQDIQKINYLIEGREVG